MSIKILHEHDITNPSFIYIDESYPEDAVFQLKKCISEGIINPSDFNAAYLWYKPSIGIPKEGSEHFPLQVISKSSILYISGVSAGYSGESPLATISCLELLGFKLSSDEVKTIQSAKNDNDLITIKFTK